MASNKPSSPNKSDTKSEKPLPVGAPVPEITLDEQSQVRRSKLEALRASGRAYPHSVKVSNTCDEILKKFGAETDAVKLNSAGSFVIAGRVAFIRSFGKAGFVKIKDRSGTLQLYVARDKVKPTESFSDFETLDLGDIVWAQGSLFRTKTGELSLEVVEFRLLNKCLHAPPEKFHGLTDIEEKYRRRYLDLMTSDETRKIFKLRSQIVQGVREYFLEKDFIEVETPMMHPLVTGATARPFVTHHNTLDMELFLRIAPELYLKRLVVGGFERVFEINRNFRNEGMSIRHNPEFTMLEFYMAYATYHTLMDMTEELIRNLAQKLLGTTDVEFFGHKVNLGQPWKRLSMEASVREFSAYKGKFTDLDALRAYLKTKGVQLSGREGAGALLTLLFDTDVEDKLIAPTFITSYPVEVSPLARRSDSLSPEGLEVTDRFELYVCGQEIANGFNELNDPDDQKARFESQVKEKSAGNLEANDYDEDYIRALEYGLPPTAGEGIGIDRLVMLLTNSSSIRDVILFPQLKKEN